MTVPRKTTRKSNWTVTNMHNLSSFISFATIHSRWNFEVPRWRLYTSFQLRATNISQYSSCTIKQTHTVLKHTNEAVFNDEKKTKSWKIVYKNQFFSTKKCEHPKCKHPKEIPDVAMNTKPQKIDFAEIIFHDDAWTFQQQAGSFKCTYSNTNTDGFVTKCVEFNIDLGAVVQWLKGVNATPRASLTFIPCDLWSEGCQYVVEDIEKMWWYEEIKIEEYTSSEVKIPWGRNLVMTMWI